VAGMMGPVLAEDAMSTPMSGDAMAPMSGDAMAPMSGDMANTMMTPNDMLAACLKNAGMLNGTEAQDAGKKTCNDAMALAMGNMSAPMGGDAMAPMNGMAADPGAMAPAK
jgi:hypothetical protein